RNVGGDGGADRDLEAGLGDPTHQRGSVSEAKLRRARGPELEPPPHALGEHGIERARVNQEEHPDRAAASVGALHPAGYLREPHVTPKARPEAARASAAWARARGSAG